MGSAMAYLTCMTGCGSLTAVALQMLRGQPLFDMVRLPLKVMVAGFFGVALYTIMLAKAFGMAAPADIGQINLLNYLWPVWMVVLGILLLVLIGCSGAADCGSRDDLSQEDLLECVSGEGARQHLDALQDIADDNGGNRAAGTPG